MSSVTSGIRGFDRHDGSSNAVAANSGSARSKSSREMPRSAMERGMSRASNNCSTAANQALHLLGNRMTAQAEQVGHGGVLLVRIIPALVRRGHELGRDRRVESNHVRQHERIGAAVGDAEASAEGVRQRMIDPDRRVRKCQRRDAGGVVHHAARLQILRLAVSDGQIAEHQADCLHRVRVGVWRSKNRNAGFERVGEAVDTGVGSQPFRHRHDELRIDNRHVGRQRIVGEGHFAPARAIDHDGERSHFAAGPAGGGDGDQPHGIRFLGREIGRRACGYPGMARPVPRDRRPATRTAAS